MAKATKGAGDSYTPEEKQDPDPPIRIRRALLGEVDKPLVGGGLSQSSKSGRTSRPSGKRNPRKAVPTMGNRSQAQGSETPSDVDSTDGNGPATETESNKSPVIDPDDDF